MQRTKRNSLNQKLKTIPKRWSVDMVNQKLKHLRSIAYLESPVESFALFSTNNRFEINMSIVLLLQNLPLLINLPDWIIFGKHNMNPQPVYITTIFYCTFTREQVLHVRTLQTRETTLRENSIWICHQSSKNPSHLKKAKYRQHVSESAFSTPVIEVYSVL